MTSPSSMREALIAEALGEVGGLLERVEALTNSLDEVRHAIESASAQLQSDLRTLGPELPGLTRQARVDLMEQLLRRVARAVTESAAEQSQALFERLDARLAHVQGSLQAAVPRAPRPWEAWATHAATATLAAALASCICSWCLLQ